MQGIQLFLSFDEAIASAAIIVIRSGRTGGHMDGRAGGNAFEASNSIYRLISRSAVTMRPQTTSSAASGRL